MAPKTGPGSHFLDRKAICRLAAAHLRAFQDRRISEGRVPSGSSLEEVVARSPGGIESIALDEAAFGLDSLALLDLVMEVTEFFNLHDSGVEDYLLIRRNFGDWVSLIQQHFQTVGTSAKLTFRTSGSTGDPKRVVITAHLLDQEAAALNSMLALKGRPVRRVLSTIAPQHLYGTIWSVVLPKHLGCEVIDRYKASPLGTGKASVPGDLVLATPYLWEKQADLGVRFSEGCIGVSSGAPATAATFEAARAAGIDLLLDIYGSTETGGLAVRRDASESFRLLPHVARSEEELTRTADGERLAVQDILDWRSGDRFKIVGRRDKVVQVAGTNVDLDLVQTVITALPCVRDAIVRPDGPRLKAYVVPRGDDLPSIETAIRTALRRLPAAARPDRMTFGNALPRNAIGKPTDWIE